MFYQINKRLIWEVTSIIILTCITYLFSYQSMRLFAFYHSALSELEFWRVLTASFCHTNLNHLLMNIVGLVVTVLLFLETYQKYPLWPIIIFNSVFVGLGIFFFDPSIQSYVGLSAVLHGLFSFAVIDDIKRKDKWGWILGAGIIGKLAHEQIFGASQITIEQIGGPVLINGHLYGAIAGVIFYCLYPLSFKLQNSASFEVNKF